MKKSYRIFICSLLSLTVIGLSFTIYSNQKNKDLNRVLETMLTPLKTLK